MLGGFGDWSEHLAPSGVVRIPPHQKVHDFVLLLALKLGLEGEVVRVELALVLLAGAHLVQGELLDGFDGVVAGEEQREQLVRGGVLGDEQRLVLRVGLEGGRVHPDQTARFLLEAKSGRRKNSSIYDFSITDFRFDDLVSSQYKAKVSESVIYI